MLYKTIILNLLEQNPPLHEELRRKRKLLATLNRLAEELREDHLVIKERLRKASPRMGKTQIATEALELALKDLCSALAPTGGQTDDATAPIPHSPHA